MRLIKNFDGLAINNSRKIALEILEAGLEAIQPEVIFKEKVRRQSSYIQIDKKEYNLANFEKIYLLGFGKGSASICQLLEKEIGDKLTAGYVIDTVEKEFEITEMVVGTHPLPSKINLDFTEKVISELGSLDENDLVLVVVCGGGSALFESPKWLTLPKLETVSEKLLKSGANIQEVNIVRKHLSKVKGGGLAKILFPAKVVSLIFSDVPGNNLSVIASGPTAKDKSSKFDVERILEKYHIAKDLIPDEALVELPQDPKYFQNVDNQIILSNLTCLEAMREKAKELGYQANILSDRIQGDALLMGHRILDKTQRGEISLVGGETTIIVKGNGKGGRNQSVVLAATPHIGENDLILAIDTDGVDYYHFAGALADSETVKKASALGISREQILKDNNTFEYFEKTGDGIITGKLETNLADIIMVLKL